MQATHQQCWTLLCEMIRFLFSMDPHYLVTVFPSRPLRSILSHSLIPSSSRCTLTGTVTQLPLSFALFTMKDSTLSKVINRQEAPKDREAKKRKEKRDEEKEMNVRITPAALSAEQVLRGQLAIEHETRFVLST